MKREQALLIILLLHLIYPACKAQNLVPNPGFEEAKGKQVRYWKQPVGGYYHYNPKSSYGAINGICFHYGENTEYMSVKLRKPLIPGHKYCLTFRAKRHYYQPRIEILFTNREYEVSDLTTIREIPHLKLLFRKGNGIFETLSGTFTAKKPDDYMVIGRFGIQSDEFYSEDYIRMAENIQAKIANCKANLKNEIAEAYQNSSLDKSDPMAKFLFTKRYRNPAMDEAMDSFTRELDSLNMQFLRFRGYTGAIFFDDFCLTEITEESGPCSVVSLPDFRNVINKPLPYRLEGVRFALDSDSLEKESYPTLDSLADYLKKQEIINILISGHTDSTGNEPHNLDLSYARANAVRNYLKSKGIASRRLRVEGKGSSVPVSTNSTTVGRKWNRRVEFVVDE